MEISKYTNGIIFVDDKYEQVKFIIKYFQSNGIRTVYVNPNDIEEDSVISFYGFRFVFLDLDLFGKQDKTTDSINVLRKICEFDLNHLVIILWTEHEEEYDNFIVEVNNKMASCLPLIIIKGNKSELMDLGEDKIGEKIDELFSKSIEENKSLYKLLEWEKNSISTINEKFNKLIDSAYNGEVNNANLDKVLGIYSCQSLNSKSIISSFETLNTEVSDNILKKVYDSEDYELDFSSSDISFTEKMSFNHSMLFNYDVNGNPPGCLYLNKEYNKDLFDECNIVTVEDNIVSGLNHKSIEYDKLLSLFLDITPNCTSKKEKDRIMLNCYLIEKITKENTDYKKIINIIKNDIGVSRQNFKIVFYMIDENLYCLIIDFLRCSSINIEKEHMRLCFQIKNEYKKEIQQEFGAFATKIGTNLFDF